MPMRWILVAMAVCLFNCTSATMPKTPAFVLDQLKSPHVLRAKTYLATDGRVRKLTVYVTRDAIPEWVFAVVTEKVGSGEDKAFEIEHYEGGDDIYEVERIADGKPVEVSVRTDRTVNYVERWVDPTALPAPIQAAVASVAGFSVETAARREVVGATPQYELSGKIGDNPHKLIVDETGRVETSSRILSASVSVDL